jgi:hypothetical protein
MIKTLLKFLAKHWLRRRSSERGYRYASRPWKRKRWKDDDRRYASPPYGYDKDVYARPRGIKGLIFEALRRRFGR